MLVTLRSVVKPLRKPAIFAATFGVVADMNARHGKRFRIVHFSLQVDSVLLIVEAPNRKALLAGVRGVAVSLARRVNEVVSRRGRLFDDRWQGDALPTPEAVRAALVRLFNGFKRPAPAGRPSPGRRPRTSSEQALDPFSSAPFFPGFAEYSGKPPLETEPTLLPRALRDHGIPVVDPVSALLADGWLRLGRLSVDEVPKAD